MVQQVEHLCMLDRLEASKDMLDQHPRVTEGLGIFSTIRRPVMLPLLSRPAL